MSSLRRDIKAIFFIGVCSNPINVSFACDHKHEFALRVIGRKLILIHMNVQLFNKKPVQDLHIECIHLCTSEGVRSPGEKKLTQRVFRGGVVV